MTQLLPGEYDAVLNDIRLHYTIRGSGPALIAISGGPGMDARGWDDFAGIDDFVTVIQIHPRGSGLSESAPADAYRLPDYASDIEALRLHLGHSQPIIMGWSHGGMVAQQFAFAYPGSLSKLILYDTAAYFGEFLNDVAAAVKDFKDQPWFEDSFAALQDEWGGNYHTDEEMTALWTREMKFYFKHFGPREAAYHERTKHLPVRIAPLKTFNEREAASMDLRPHLKNIAVPTLVIVGRHDFITTAAMAEEIVRHIPAARLEIFEDSGHFAMVEEQEKFYQVVKQFVLNAP